VVLEDHWIVRGAIGTFGYSNACVEPRKQHEPVCRFPVQGETYIRSSVTTDNRRAEIIEQDWRRQLHNQKYLDNEEQIQISDILDQFICNSWNLICQKMAGLDLPVSIGKVCGFLNQKKLNGGFRCKWSFNLI